MFFCKGEHKIKAIGCKGQAARIVDSDPYKLLAYENFKTHFNQIAHPLGYKVEYMITKPLQYKDLQVDSK